jgi:hypothetical protein
MAGTTTGDGWAAGGYVGRDGMVPEGETNPRSAQ